MSSRIVANISGPSFLIFFAIAVFSPCFLLVGLLLQYVALFQSRELVKG